MTPARTTTDLILHAEDMGARVVWALDLPERGRTYPHVGVIVIRHGMTERRTVSTLGHELAPPGLTQRLPFEPDGSR